MPPPLPLTPRKMLELDTEDHPGSVEIMGVQLDLAVQADAALAAKWLDGQVAALGDMLARRR